jgi:hypothetical protein
MYLDLSVPFLVPFIHIKIGTWLGTPSVCMGTLMSTVYILYIHMICIAVAFGPGLGTVLLRIGARHRYRTAATLPPRHGREPVPDAMAEVVLLARRMVDLVRAGYFADTPL